VKLTLRNFLHPTYSKPWKEFLLTKFIPLPHELLVLHQAKVHRPFYDKRFSRKEKFSLLKHCYESLVLKFNETSLRKLMTPEGMEVCNFASKNGDEYRIILSTDIQYSREGFFTLVLFDKLGKIMTIAFSIDFSTPKPRLLIGSLQATPVDGLSRIRHATHEMFGLQPRMFLIHLVKVFGNILGVQEIEAITDHNHVYNSLRYRRRLKKQVSILRCILERNRHANSQRQLQHRYRHPP
jgi:hypothetical protein